MACHGTGSCDLNSLSIGKRRSIEEQEPTPKNTHRSTITKIRHLPALRGIPSYSAVETEGNSAKSCGNASDKRKTMEKIGGPRHTQAGLRPQHPGRIRDRSEHKQATREHAGGRSARTAQRTEACTSSHEAAAPTSNMYKHHSVYVVHTVRSKGQHVAPQASTCVYTRP